jgi:hypothetical protein
MQHSCRTALAALLCLAPMAASAAPVLDLGLRASIYDENYELGVGGELGAIASAGEAWDLGLHLNYSHFAAQTENWTSAEEFGGYVAAYFKPRIDQAFWLRLGPHLGYSHVVDHYLDLGGDVQAVFKTTPALDFYAAFVPSFFIGEHSQAMIRIGLGLQYRAGGR